MTDRNEVGAGMTMVPVWATGSYNVLSNTKARQLGIFSPRGGSVVVPLCSSYVKRLRPDAGFGELRQY
jgi:hypothetical protein